MRKLILYFIVLNIFLLSSCTDSDNNDMCLIQLDIDNASASTNWAAVLDTTYFKAIALETTDDCLIGEVLKIIYADDMLIVADNMSHSVFFFNTEGKFLNSICKIGRGPDEYFELTDISVRDGKVWLLDNISCKVLCYDYTGKMLHKFNTQGGVSIQALENSILIGDVWGGVAAGGPYLLSEFDFNGKQIGSYIPYKKSDKDRDSGDWQPFSGGVENSTYFLVSSKNEVWSYNNKKASLAYKFDLGKYEMPDKYKKLGLEYIITNKLHEQYSLGVYNLWESTLYRFAIIYCKGDKYLCIIDKKNSNVISLSKSMFFDVFNISAGTIIKTDGDYLLSYHSSNTLVGLRDYMWNPDNNTPIGGTKELYRLSQNMSADDNGVIVMMRLKQ